MRKLALAITAALALLAASFVSPIGAGAASVTPGPGTPGLHSGARPAPARGPFGRLTAAAPRTASITCAGVFNTVASANGTGNNLLTSTSAVNANDVWAVGHSTNGGGFDQTLAEHWDGTTWSIVSTPNPSSFSNDLTGVIAISTNDVWAVGVYATNAGGTNANAFAAHWDGSGWNWYLLQPVPNNPFSVLFAVSASSTSDVWAVGTYYSAGFLPLAYHWNGVNWSPVFPPNPSPTDNELFGISAFSSTDIWSVGEVSGGIGTPLQSLAQHWDGSTWTTIATPNIGAGADNEILGVNALEAGHAVGVGFGNFVSGSTPEQGEAWDLLASGSSTSAVESGPGPGDNQLNDVTRSAGGVWAVGYSRVSASTAPQTLVIPATWNSTAHTLTWSPIGTSDNPSATNNDLLAVTAVSPYSFWAVGFQNTAGTDQSLTEVYCARDFSVTAPPSTARAAPFSVTVTEQNGDGTTFTGYRGTVHFSSTDNSAVLPANYTFTSGDNGVHTFSGVVLNTTCVQAITAADIAMPFTMPGSAFITVSGVCQSTAGTAGTRATNTGPAGTAGTRSGATQSGAGTPGPRLPRISAPAQSADSAPTLGAPMAPDLASKGGAPARAAGSSLSKGAPQTGASNISHRAPSNTTPLLVARTEPVSRPPEQSVWYLLLLTPLLVCLLALGELRRRRFKEKSNARI